MKRRIISALLALIVFISSLPVEAAASTEEEYAGMTDEAVYAAPSSVERTADEPETDNTEGWNLSIVFYDSTVGDGKIPLDHIDWDASDGGYSSGSPRVITVQVTYSNAYSVTTYEPGDLTITIPNLIYSLSSRADSSYNTQWTAAVEVSTLSPVKPYDPFEVWSFMDGSTSPGRTQEMYVFTNVLALEADANYEGSFQIQYTITPASETPEKYLEECVHEYEKELQATLSGAAQASSNTIDFDYTRIYKHPWQRVNYTIYKYKNSALTSYDGLVADADDYIWVSYGFRVYRNTTSTSYPYVPYDQLYFTDELPAGCIVLSSAGKEEALEDGCLKVPVTGWDSSYAYFTYVVGYPREIYEENKDEDGKLEIENTAELYGHYPIDEDDEASFLNDSTVKLDMADYEHIIPPGELYRLSKSGQTYFEINYSSDATNNKSSLRYQSILEDDQRNMIRWTITATARYWGSPMTVEIGDDLIYHIKEDGTYERATDDEYYFTRIVIPVWKNANGITISSGKYNYDLFVRYEDEKDYVKFNEEPYTNGSKTITLTENSDKHVVAWYIRIYDLLESLESMAITTDMYFTTTADEIPTGGTLYNFDFLKVYIADDDGNAVLQNRTDGYDFNISFNDDIADFDRENHDGCIHRASSSKTWVDFAMREVTLRQALSKTHNGIYLSATDEYFYGSFTVTNKLQGSYDLTAINHEFFEQIRDQDFFTDFTFYDLLPEGMELISSEEELLASITVTSSNRTSAPNFWTKDGETAFQTTAEAAQFFRDRSTITITRDWNGTGRTRIKLAVDFHDLPLFCFGSQYKSNSGTVSTYHGSISFSYNYGISYDSFLTYGKTYKNYAYLQSEDMSSVSTKINDSGVYDPDSVDITEDGSTEDQLGYASANAVISYLVSTYQDLTKFVLTDTIDDYKTGSARTTPEGEYTYKLRVRSGQSDITDLVIYDSIEQYAKDKDENIVPAYGNNEYWRGEFLGVDVSFAEARSYTVYAPNHPDADDDGYVIEDIKVKVWYWDAADTLPQDLYNDMDGTQYNDLWKEYPRDDSAFDKSVVKALAFEFLNQDGNHAILPTNVMTYVLIKMKAPADKDITTLAYNGAWTEWRALDDKGVPVDFITGINSNIVKVSMNETVDVEGTKTWEGDKEETRPAEITVILLQDGEEYDRVTVSAETKWKYFFDGLPKYRADGSEYEYSIKEEHIEGYRPEYAKPVNALRITFNENTRTYGSSTYGYIEVYYEIDGMVYLKGKYGGTSLAGATIEVPTDNFYIYLYVYSSSSIYTDYYGFSIDSIEPYDGIVMPGSVSFLPNKEPIEALETYPESAHNPHEKTSTLWHYTYRDSYDEPHPGAYDVINVDAHIDIQGMKSWDENVMVYPDSVTVNLLRDGVVYRTAVVTAGDDWKYVFADVPKFREDGSEYEYSVEEEPIEGFVPSYGTLAVGLVLKFNENSRTEGTGSDYVYIYYEHEGELYRLGPYGSTTIANATVKIPADNFWLYWRTDYSVHDYYGFSIDSIELVDIKEDWDQGTAVSALPDYACTELEKGIYPESLHSPYEDNTNELWHYTDKYVWSDTPQIGRYDIINQLSENELPVTGGPGDAIYKTLWMLYGAIVGCTAAGCVLSAGKKRRKIT